MRLQPKQTPFKVTLGERGEMIAWDYLRKAGYKILEKNYRCKLGEIDVVAEKKGKLVFVEVKTRSSHHYGMPEEAVHRVKQQKMARVGEWYQKEKKREKDSISFAVVAIDWSGTGEPAVRLVENAFNFDE